MVRVYKFFAYLLFFIMMLLVFIPKENLFYLLEKELAKEELYISNERLKEELFTLKIQNASLSYKGIAFADVQEIESVFLFFYNEVSFKDMKLSSLLANYWPQKVQTGKISYSVLNPLDLQAVAKGDFGEIHAKYSLQKRVLKVFLTPSKLMLQKYRNSLRYFKKLKTGEYSYEKSL